MNIVVISGNIVRDPELRYLPSGMVVCSLTVAVNKKRKKPDGTFEEKVAFIGCNAFGKIGENIAQYFKKGSPIMIQGELEQETWEDKATGVKKEKTKVLVTNFEFMDKKSTSDAPKTPAPPSQPRVPMNPMTRPVSGKVDYDADNSDVPF